VIVGAPNDTDSTPSALPATSHERRVSIVTADPAGRPDNVALAISAISYAMAAATWRRRQQHPARRAFLSSASVIAGARVLRCRRHGDKLRPTGSRRRWSTDPFSRLPDPLAIQKSLATPI
jgi:hypothetical protein